MAARHMCRVQTDALATTVLHATTAPLVLAMGATCASAARDSLAMIVEEVREWRIS